MIKFNDKDIFIGYIKELLHTFNLPSIKVFKEDSFVYEGALFIRNNYIQQYVGNQFKNVIPFTFNRQLLNYTKTLDLENNYYDSHTHEYLGEYLRFIRDYKNLDLMSMYNCFSNNIVSSLYLNWKNDSTDLKFFTEDNYKVYAIPVKFGKKYTIAFSATSPVEIVCGLHSKGIIEYTPKDETEINQTAVLYNKTYKRISISEFKKPFVYDSLTDDSLKTKFLYEHENDLKLFIKLPINNNTSIVVLEGEYLNTNQRYISKKSNTADTWKHGRVVYNFKIGNEDKELKDINSLKFFSSLQLLEINSNTFYAFADRLIEYLTDNSVTNIEIISDNIKRMQEALIKRKADSRYQKDGRSFYSKTGLEDYKHSGIWEDRYRGILYNIAAEEGVLDSKFDVLGYLDKDVELKLRSSEVDIYQKE